MKQTNKNSTSGFIQNIFQHAASHVNRVVQNLNSSRLFAGCMIIVLNIGSKYVNIKLSKSVEAYLKYTFSKQVMVFAIAWMGTRDIYIALLIATLFTLFIEFLFNEESKYCCLTESFTDYHLGLLESENTKAEDKPVPVTTIDSTKKTDLSNSATQNNNPFTNDKFGNVVEEHISIDEKTIIPNVKEISEMYESSLFYAPFSK
jgi:hypothetical protein